MNTFTNITLTFLFGSISLNAAAVELAPLTADELIYACKTISDGELEANENKGDSGLCRGYILGYFAATPKVVVQENMPSDLTLRAMKTRGVRLSEEQNNMLVAPYCISKDEMLMSVVNKVVNVDASIAEGRNADDILEHVLFEHYLCASN